MKIPFRLSILAVSVALAGCGGSGSNPTIGSSSYFSSPTVVGRFDPSEKTTTSAFEYNSFTADVTGDGATDVVFAGRQTATNDLTQHSNSTLQLYTWENGTLVNKTSQWFDNNDNIIKGTEPSVQFVDFWNTGRTDMFVAHGTDMRYYGSSYVFRNTGTKFEKIEIPMANVWSHGSDVGDVNGDSFADIIVIDYGINTTLAINNTVNNFTTYVDSRGINGELRWGGSDVIMGDFLNNGTTQFIVTDNACQLVVPNCQDNYSTRMYTYVIDPISDELNFKYIKDLPLPRLESPTYDPSVDDHNVRIVSHDFNEDGSLDVIVFSRDLNYMNKVSEIQFLQNDGSGNFSDVTDNILIGYDKNTHSTYRPTFFDLNNDGKTDILVSGGDWTNENNSHQFLIKSADNKYIAAYQDILTDFAKGVDVSDGYINGGNSINVFRAPNGDVYLVSWFNKSVNSDRVMDVYLSKLNDTTNITTAQSAVELLQSTWSYLSTEQAQQALNSTALPFEGAKIIDVEKAMQPVGDLNIDSIKIQGSLSLPGVNPTILANTTIKDSLNRHYTSDLSGLANNYESNISVPQQHATGLYAIGNNAHFNAGYSVPENNNWFYSFGMTKQPHSPWLHFDGMFGSINSSTIVDFAVGQNANQGLWHQTGLMQSKTDFTPGLITNVEDIYSIYTMGGYRYKKLNVYGGVKPKIIYGSVDIKLPKSVDTDGSLLYNDYTLKLKNKTLGYIGVDYSFVIDAVKALEWNVSAQIDSAGHKEGSLAAGLPW